MITEELKNILIKSIESNTISFQFRYSKYIDNVNNVINSGNINYQNNDGWTLLMELALDHNDANNCLKYHSTDIIRLLLDNNADMNLQNIYGNTVLHIAAYSNNYSAIKSFLQRGINPNVTNNEGETPIMFAILHKSIQIVELLIQYGADLTIQDKNGMQIFDYLISFKNEEIENLIDNSKKIRQDFLQKQKLKQQIEEDKNKTPDELIKEARENFGRILKK